MRNFFLALYSACVYVVFFITFLYLIGFVEGLVVPKSINTGQPGALSLSLIINLSLVALFGLQHSVMARPGFKQQLTKIIPSEAERSTFVLAASLVLILLFVAWRPMPQLVWSLENPVVVSVLSALSWVGWSMVLLSTFLISHFHLFGLSQGFARVLKLKDQETAHFVTPLFYRWMRHPIYVGFMIAFWATPTMSLGHLIFASAMTVYIVIGVWYEERDLITEFGERYLHYREKVGMFWPKWSRRIKDRIS